MQNKKKVPEQEQQSNRQSPYVEFNKVETEINRNGDGPPVASFAAETLKPNSQPGDKFPGKSAKKSPNKSFKKVLKEYNFDRDHSEEVRKYLHKRRMAWFFRIDEATNVNQLCQKLEDFVEYTSMYLDLQDTPPITIKATTEGSTFATWSPDGIEISVTNRHPMDVFRSLAHELVHQKQYEDDALHNESGVTGSEHENEANALAGIIMRNYAKSNPELFGLEYIEEGRRRAGGGIIGMIFAKIAANREAKAAAAEAEAQEIARQNREEEHKRNKEKFAAEKKIKERNQEKRGLAQHQAWRSTAEKFDKNLEQFHKNRPPIVKGFGKNLKESICLLNKSTKSGISYGVILEVFDRGIEAWNKDMKIPQVQFAFNRVDSWLAGGKARELDKDLWIKGNKK